MRLEDLGSDLDAIDQTLQKRFPEAVRLTVEPSTVTAMHNEPEPILVRAGPRAITEAAVELPRLGELDTQASETDIAVVPSALIVPDEPAPISTPMSTRVFSTIAGFFVAATGGSTASNEDTASDHSLTTLVPEHNRSAGEPSPAIDNASLGLADGGPYAAIVDSASVSLGA